MRIDIAIRFWTSVKMVCYSMERWAFCERRRWDLERLCRSCHCGQTDRMLKREEPSTAATFHEDIFLPFLNIALSRPRAAWLIEC